MDSQKLIDFIEKNYEENIITSLSKYITVPNLSPNFDPNWDTNNYQMEALDVLYNWVNALQLQNIDKLNKIKDKNKTPLLFVEIKATNDEDKNKTVLFYGHLDKQPPFTGWRDDLGPNKPKRDGDLLYGRGAADDGYSTYAALIAIKAIQDQKLPHPRIVLIIEGSEESGSPDLAYYLTKLADLIGNPQIIVCLDSGICDYSRLWITTSLRGLILYDVTVQCLSKGIHSGKGTGIAPDSFKIMRNIIGKFEDCLTGEIPALEVDIPQDVIDKAQPAIDVLKDTYIKRLPLLDGVRLLSDDFGTLYINNTWKPSLVIAGATGIPSIKEGGNVLLPYTKFRMSIRLPPTLVSEIADKKMQNIILEDPLFNCSITVDRLSSATGWKCNEHTKELKTVFNKASSLYFSNNESCEMYVGGTIPFMNIISELFPKAQFIATGVCNVDSNAHGPNENVNIPYLKKFTCCLSQIISEYALFL